jgi:tetratricopeptide (TPR) repeat protein
MIRTRLLYVVTVFVLAPVCVIAQLTASQQRQFAEHMQKAQTYLRNKQPRLAIPELEAAAAIDPSSVDARGNLGVLLFFEGKASEAIPHLRFALEQQPGMTRLQGLLGMAEAQTLDIANARRDLDAAFNRTDDIRIKVEVGLALVSLDSATGELDKAAAVVTELRKIAPENPAVLYAAFRTYTDLAGETMLALSLAAPDSAQMHQLIAHEDTRLGNTAAAIMQYRKAIAIDPRLPGVHFELAEVLNHSSDMAAKEEAEREYRAALKQNPADEKALVRLGEIASRKGNEDEAFADFTRAAELDPSDTDAKLGLAKALIDKKEINMAETLLEEIIRMEPSNALAHYRLGTLYHKQGRDDDAKREIDEYKRLKEMKAKLQAIYDELRIQPKGSQLDEDSER